MAEEVASDDLPTTCAIAYTDVGADAVAFAPEQLRGDADLRLYVARAERHQVHVRGSDPTYGKGIDSRRTVDL